MIKGKFCISVSGLAGSSPGMLLLPDGKPLVIDWDSATSACFYLGAARFETITAPDGAEFSFPEDADD